MKRTICIIVSAVMIFSVIGSCFAFADQVSVNAASYEDMQTGDGEGGEASTSEDNGVALLPGSDLGEGNEAEKTENGEIRNDELQNNKNEAEDTNITGTFTIGDYVFTITGQDESGNDILLAKFRDTEIADKYILVKDKVYYFAKGGKGTLYTKAGTVKLSDYQFKDDAVTVSENSVYVKDAMLYYGVYKKYWYEDGRKIKNSERYIVWNGYLYKIKKSGEAAMYKKSGNGSYSILAWEKREEGTQKKYLYKVTSKTARAGIVIKDASRIDSYKCTVGNKLYLISYATGESQGLFSGCHSNKIYKNGVVDTSVNGFMTADKTGMNGDYYFNKGVVVKSSSAWYKPGKCYDENGNELEGEYMYKIKPDGTYCIYKKETEDPMKQVYKNASGLKYVVRISDGYIVGVAPESAVRQKLLKAAYSYLGFEEGLSKKNPKSHWKILNIYNKGRLPRGHRMIGSDAWCAAYVSAMFIKSGLSSIFPKECSCRIQVSLWKAMNCWVENDAYVPNKGDVIYYHWKSNCKGNCKEAPGHVGIVDKVEGGIITVIEGNVGNHKNHDKVVTREIKVNHPYIRGYGVPKFSKKAKK